MSEHARLSASGSERWMNCPGSVRMEDGRPDVTTWYAGQGTAAHEIAARCLREGRDAGEFVGEEVETDYGPIEVDEDMAASVQVYLDHCRKILAGAPKGAKFFIEKKFSLEKLNPPDPMFGTTDFAIWFPDREHLDVNDYKHGWLYVPAEENWQLTYYALGAVLALNVKPKTITTRIVQPNRPGSPVRSETFRWDELVVRKRELFAAAERALDSDAPLNPGDWCQFCRAAPVCPALAEQTYEVVQAEFSEITEDDDGEPNLPAPDTLDDSVLREVLEKRKMIERWFDAIEEHVQQRLEVGGEFPGFKLIEKRATRRWVDEEKMLAWARQLGLTDEDLYKTKLQSPYGVEQALKRHYPDHKERPALPEDLVFEKSSGYNVVEESHPKPAAQVVDATEAFAGVLPPAKAPDGEAATQEEHDG